MAVYHKGFCSESLDRKTFITVRLSLLVSNCGKVVLVEKHRPENRPKGVLSHVLHRHFIPGVKP